MGPNIIIKNWKWIALTLIFWFIAFKCIPIGFHDLGGGGAQNVILEDSAQYIILGESVSKGLGLKLVNYPQEPPSFYYPPVLCFLLSPIIYFFGRDFYLMHIMIASLGFFSLYFFYQIFKRYSSPFLATLGIFLFATNWAFIILSAEYILSDIPYLFFSGFTLFMAIRYVKELSCFNKSAIFLLIGLILSYFTRYNGLILFLSIIVILLLTGGENKFKKAALIGGIFILVFAAWNVLESLYASRLASHSQLFFLIDPYSPDKGSVLSHPFELVTRFVGGINRVFVLLGHLTFFHFVNKGPQLNDILSGFILIFVLAGLWFKFREDKFCIFHYYFSFYLISIFLWLFNDSMEGIRYLLPVLPFIIFYFLAGLFRVLDFILKRLYPVLLPVFVCSFFMFNFFNLALIPKSSQWSLGAFPVSFRNFVLLHSWINKNISDKEVIASRKPALTFLYTNHKSVGFPYTSDAERIWCGILKDNAKYIIVDEFSEATYLYLSRVLYKYKNNLKLLYRVGETGLFEIKERG